MLPKMAFLFKNGTKPTIRQCAV